MSVPHLPKVPPAARRRGPARVRPGAARLGAVRRGVVRRGVVRPRLVLRGVLVGGALLLLAVLLASCGNAELPAAMRTPAPTSAPGAPPSPTTAPSTTDSPAPTTPPGQESTGASGRASGQESGDPARTGEQGDGHAGGNAAPAPAPAPAAQPARPLWPATDSASARDLQQQADRGGDPWLLDPEEVAISYAGSELGYRNPKVVVLAPGRVDLQDGRSRAQALVTLQQTVRSGPGGVWLVTDVDQR